MPMHDAYTPEGALTPETERTLPGAGTDLLIEHEGADPTNEKVRSLAWVVVHRHETYMAGAPAEAPHDKFVCQVPEGQYDEERGVAVPTAMTDALVEAEDDRWPDPQARVGSSRSRYPTACGAVWEGASSGWRTAPSSSSVRPVADTAHAGWPHGDGSRRTSSQTRPRSGSWHTAEVHE